MMRWPPPGPSVRGARDPARNGPERGRAIGAGGGGPSRVAAGRAVRKTAGQLAACRARMRRPAPPLDAAALEAADRSWVRQVISFGETPDAIQFGALLRMGTLPAAPARGSDPALLPYVRKPDGMLGPAPLSHRDLAGLLRRLDVDAAIGETDVVLAAPPAGDGRSYTALLDHALLRGATVVAACAEELATAADIHHGTAVLAAGGAAGGAGQRLRVFARASSSVILPGRPAVARPGGVHPGRPRGRPSRGRPAPTIPVRRSYCPLSAT